MAKPTVAFFDFTSCEGCQLSVLNMGPDVFLGLMDLVDIVEFREAISEKSENYDIAFIEGSYSTQRDEIRLKDIRSRAKLVIAIGACAHIGGVNAIRNSQTAEAVQAEVYPDNPTLYQTNEKALPISACIPIDGFVPGCPIDVNEFVHVVKNMLLGKNTNLPTWPVCVECKKRENSCVYEKGLTCLGPVTRAGCNAICPSSGGYCFDPNVNAQKDVFANYGLTMEKIKKQFTLFLTEAKEVQADV